MEETAILRELVSIVGNDRVRTQEPMSRHTSFRIGGPAEIFVEPTVAQVGRVIARCKEGEIPCTVIGNGSNLLVGDGGIPGVVICLGEQASGISVFREELFAEAGALLSKMAAEAQRAGLTGLEFAAGIPGSLGGAIIMNAGAYGGEMADVVREVQVLTADGDIEIWGRDDMEFGYRSSRAMKEGAIVLSAFFDLKEGDPGQIRQRMNELAERRREKQPLEYPSAGSTFKRPEGHFAGKLIMEAGLGGYRVGDAQVSEKHCGFVINRGNATASQVRQLMEDVIRQVQKTSGVTLEPEVRMVGIFSAEKG